MYSEIWVDVATGATGTAWVLDTDGVYGYDTVAFDAFSDGNYSSPYDWVRPIEDVTWFL